MRVYNDFFYQAVSDLQAELGVTTSKLSEDMGYHSGYVRTRVSADPEQPLAARMLNSLKKIAEENGMQLDMSGYVALKKVGYKAEWELSETNRKVGLKWVHAKMPEKRLSVLKKKAEPITMVKDNSLSHEVHSTFEQARRDTFNEVISEVFKRSAKMKGGSVTFDVTLTITVDSEGNVLAVSQKHKQEA